MGFSVVLYVGRRINVNTEFLLNLQTVAEIRAVLLEKFVIYVVNNAVIEFLVCNDILQILSYIIPYFGNIHILFNRRLLNRLMQTESSKHQNRTFLQVYYSYSLVSGHL